MNHPKHISTITLAIALAASLALPALTAPTVTAAAATPAPPTLTQDATYTFGNAQLTALAGSQADSLVATATTLTATVAAGEALILRAAGPTPAILENDSQLAVCNVLPSRENQLIINGPRTVTVTPSAYNCSTANASTNTTPIFTIGQPAAGAATQAGQPLQIFWSASGRAVASVRLRLSTDGGQTYPTIIADDVVNDGFESWTIPADTYTTAQARIKIEGLNGNPREVSALALSPIFAISGITPPTPWSPASATATASTIDVNQGFDKLTPSFEPLCAAGLRIKSHSNPAVYFCGADGKRHGFPNQKIHDSWYVGDFAGVVTVSDTALAQIQLGANVRYRPGVRMVKIQTDPKVYAVDANGVLRWISTEAIATALYGANWNQLIDDVPDSFFTDYAIGAPLE
ncbi:MAG: hypothetical protein WCT10_04885 [Patescibacteria group bacterium]|jgi:hypothetical protein